MEHNKFSFTHPSNLRLMIHSKDPDTRFCGYKHLNNQKCWKMALNDPDMDIQRAARWHLKG